MGAACCNRAVAETQSMKRCEYYKRTVKHHYGGELCGLAHAQLFRQRGLRGVMLGPANPGRRVERGSNI